MRLAKMFLLIVAVMGMLAVVAPSPAQEIGNDDWRSDTTNLCNEGSLAGECYFPNDEGMTEWYYNFGWWWQRVAEQDISPCQVPVEYGGFCEDGGGDGTITVVIGGRIVRIALQGSPNAGDADIVINSDNFDFATDAGTYGINPDEIDGIILYGNDNTNIIVGSPGDDEIYGEGGVDIIYGDGEGSPGDGQTYSGNDTIDGGAGNDSIVGDSRNGDNNSGNDVISGGDGIDTLRGDSEGGANNSGNDNISGDGDTDVITGDSESGDNNSGSDTIDGGEGADFISGDSLNGSINTGNDNISGGGGNDTMRGDSRDGANNSGDDTLNGGDGNDTIAGDSETGGSNTGNNEIDGGPGTDTCSQGNTSNC